MEEINQIGVQQLPYHRCTATYPYVFLTLHSSESFNQETRIVMDECTPSPLSASLCVITYVYYNPYIPTHQEKAQSAPDDKYSSP